MNRSPSPSISPPPQSLRQRRPRAGAPQRGPLRPGGSACPRRALPARRARGGLRAGRPGGRGLGRRWRGGSAAARAALAAGVARHHKAGECGGGRAGGSAEAGGGRGGGGDGGIRVGDALRGREGGACGARGGESAVRCAQPEPARRAAMGPHQTGRGAAGGGVTRNDREA